MGSVWGAEGPSWVWRQAPFQAASLTPNERKSPIEIQMRGSSVSGVIKGIQIQAAEEMLATLHLSNQTKTPGANPGFSRPAMVGAYMVCFESGSSVHIQNLKTFRPFDAIILLLKM